jgi:hypothetical protein
MRGATVLASARTNSPQRLVGLHERLRSINEPIRRGTLMAQLVLVGVVALVLVK